MRNAWSPSQISSHLLRRLSTLCDDLTVPITAFESRLHVHSPPAPTPSADPLRDHVLRIAALLSNSPNLQQLTQLHAHVIRTHLLDSFPDAFHYNNIIRAYTRLDVPVKALRVYAAMSRAGVLPDSYTIPIALKAVGHCFAFGTGLQLHSVAIKVGLGRDEFCESGFISLYAKVGDFGNARKVFDENPNRKLGSWNAVMAGLSQGGQAKEVIAMFLEMRREGFAPDGVTMVSVISSCGSLGNLDLALQLHKCVFQAEKRDLLTLNSVIDMYGKCGRMDLAYKVFYTMNLRNVSSWTSMIVGYAMNGLVTDALDCFHGLINSGVRPNHVTFVGVLSACVHGGKVEEGRHYFYMMQNVYGIRPQLQHYGCMVDLLGRVGEFDEARRMIEGMPMKPNSVVFGCLMGGCEMHGNVEVGEWVAKNLQELEPWNDGAYVVLSNIYAKRGMWRQVEKMRAIMKKRSLAKVPGYALTTNSESR